MKANRKKAISVIMATLSIVNIMACKKDQAAENVPDPSPVTVTTENVTYANFTGTLLESKCSTCHAEGASASGRWTFNGYSSVKANGDRINQAVLVSRAMPVGGSLTAQERELLDAWFKRNMPEN